MGVHGLTSFLNQFPTAHQTVTLTLPPPGTPPTAFIVDLHAFTYAISMHDEVRGGQYEQIKSILRLNVEYWKACGLAPEFVVDGPPETSKLATVVARSQQTLNRCVQYMRASDAERATPGMRRKAAKLPKLAQAAMVDELLNHLKVPVHFTEGEADAATAELAQRRQGYIFKGDYFIFPSDCVGYIPISTFEYGGTGSKNLPKVPADAPVQMRFKCYHHRAIASALAIPPGLLPLFAALAGNDHANYAAFLWTIPKPVSSTTFRNGKDKQLLACLARELARLEPLFAAAGGRPYRAAFEMVLGAVLPRLGLEGNRTQMRETLLLAAASYELKSLSTPSPTFPLHPRPAIDSRDRARCRALYFAAFQKGELSGFALNILKHGRALRLGQLEMHDLPSPGIVLGTPIRKWAYAVLAEAFGDSGRLVVTEVVRDSVKLVQREVVTENLRERIDAANEERGMIDLRLEDEERPILLCSFELRRDVFLLAFGDPSPVFLAHPLWPLLLALRHIRRHLAINPWSDHDFLAAILTGHLLLHPSLPRPPLLLLPAAPSREHIQRSAELLAALCHVACLAEVLLLHAWIDPAGHKVFDGRMMHGLMVLRRQELREAVDALGSVASWAVRHGWRLVLEDGS